MYRCIDIAVDVILGMYKRHLVCNDDEQAALPQRVR
jgi:hypothetical protein